MRKVLLLLLCLSLLSGCSWVQPSPARTNGPYRAKAIKAVEAAQASLQSALLTIELLEKQRIFLGTATVQISNDSDGASGAHHAFDRVQSPSVVSDNLQTQTDDLLNKIEAQLTSLLTAVRRHEAGGLSDSAAQLNQLNDESNQFLESKQ